MLKINKKKLNITFKSFVAFILSLSILSYDVLPVLKVSADNINQKEMNFAEEEKSFEPDAVLENENEINPSSSESTQVEENQSEDTYHDDTLEAEESISKSPKSKDGSVSTEKESADVEVIDDTPEPSIEKNTNYKSQNFGQHFKVINEQAVVYDNRGKNGLKKIGTLVKGQTYKRVSDYGNWHRIQYGNIYGYVHKENTIPGNKNEIKNINKSYKNSLELFLTNQKTVVYDNSSGKLVPFAEIEKGQKYHIATDYGNWYRVILADRIGYVKKSEVTRLFTKQTKYFEVVLEDLPVYDNRTGKLVEIGKLKKGQVYPRVSDYGNWHRIQFGDIYGYVKKSATIPADGKLIKNINKNYKNSKEKFITNKNAIIYDNSSGQLEPFAEIKKGKQFPIVSDYGNWYRVLVTGRVGYINKNDVTGYFSKATKYFEVVQDNLPVYDNRQKGKLVKVGELKKGQVYERVSDYGNWHRIQFGDIYGYVRKSGTLPNFKNKIPNYNSKYKNTELTFTTIKKSTVYDNTSGKLIPFAEIEKGKTYPVAGDYGKWYRIILANKVGYINKNDVKVSFTKNMKYFKVNKENLPIYDNRSGSLKKVGTLKKGQTYQRVSDYGNWHRIRFGNIYGYVKKSETEPSTASAYKNKTVRNYTNGKLTTKKEVVVYDNSGKSLIPFATIDKGKTYPVVRDYGNWYEINLSGRSGYVRKSEVTATVMVAKEIVNPNREYTYEHMRTDINKLAKAYPGLISWKSIGKSVDGRNIYAIKLGNGKKEIFLNGAHHAREWLTTNLLMEMIDEYSQAYVKNQRFHGYDVRSILDKVSIWFVPMVNPDGVTLVQKGAFSAKNPKQVLKLNGGNTNFKAWKANIRGVDLNRQYPADWKTIRYVAPAPGPMNYKGKAPLTEPEVKAIYDFTLKHNFKTAVAYHSSGEILYWDFKTKGSLKTLSRKIANQISKKTGYSLVFPGPNPSGGGYTDWFLQDMKKPGFTPEISPYVGNRPVPVSYFNSIWKKNDTIGLMLAKEAATR